MSVLKNLSGKRFGKLVAISPVLGKNPYKYLWLFKCDCGKTKEISKYSVLSGRTTSCGCFQKSRVSRVGGLSYSRLYRIWSHMKDRCYNKKNEAYKNYGGRGINVCKEWNGSFLRFKKWSFENGYRDKLTIDRINTNGNYEPSNCRWVTMKEQQRNKRNNKKVLYKGKSICLSEVSEIEKIDLSTISGRIKRGVPLEKSLLFRNKIYRGKELFCENNGKTYANAIEFLRDVGLKRTGKIYDFLNGKLMSDSFCGYKIKRIQNL